MQTCLCLVIFLVYEILAGQTGHGYCIQMQVTKSVFGLRDTSLIKAHKSHIPPVYSYGQEIEKSPSKNALSVLLIVK